jgi:hypothetical protein
MATVIKNQVSTATT